MVEKNSSGVKSEVLSRPNRSMPIRTYADTFVYGGPYDEEFAEASRRFFAQVRVGRFLLVTSAVVSDELEEAPPKVQANYDTDLGG